MNEKVEESHTQQIPQQQPTGAYMPYHPQYVDDGIYLYEYWQVIWRRKWLIISIASTAAILSIAYSLTLPNYYKASVLLSPVSVESSGGLASKLGGLGGLASLAGVSLPGGGNAEENLAILKTYNFIIHFVDDNNLMQVLFEQDWNAGENSWVETDPEKQPSAWDAYRVMTSQVLNVSQNKKNGMITLSAEWTDPALATQWANGMVTRLNNYVRVQAVNESQRNLTYLEDQLGNTKVAEMRQTLYELISTEQHTAMLANTKKEYAFRVLGPAIQPDKKSKPKRSLIVIFTTMLSGIFAVLLAFSLDLREKRT